MALNLNPKARIANCLVKQITKKDFCEKEVSGAFLKDNGVDMIYFLPKAGKYINGLSLTHSLTLYFQIVLDMVSGRDIFRYFWTLKF